ncbi:MAG: pilus assembly protein [Bdellovibrionales bacterium]
MLNFFKKFVSNESGMTLPMLGLAFMTVCGFVGMSVDVARLQLVQSRLSFALDAAGLAAGSTVNTSNLSAEVAKYLNANYPTNYMGSTAPNISATVSDDKSIINLTASTKLPTTFMAVLGKTELDVTASTEITRETTGLELVMALDNTGSMSGSKLTALKNAAKSLVNILFGTKESVDKLWVGLVPFAQSVNIGTSNSAWIDQTHFSSLIWGPTSWGGCVDARDQAAGRDVTDDPPSVEKYKAYYSPSTDNRPAPYNTPTYLNYNKWVASRYADGTPKTFTSITSSRGPNAYCSATITPLTASKSTILAGLNNMAATGNTHINLGAIWAWNMLSPRWRGTWGGEMTANSLPLDYGAEHMNKAVILMTDGDNTMSQPLYTAYGYLSDGRLGTTSNTSTARTTLNNKLSGICSAMKAKGIYVYSIVLGNPSTSTQTLMKNCASAENFYFLSPSSGELEGVFSTIADSLSSLRISK